jgi:Pyruvate/2-oxoacid:ferredoxin oxidoreductase delta subunit
VAIDTVACLIVDVNPEFVPTNVCGRIAGLGTDLIENIEVRGEQISKVLDKSFVAVRKPPVPLPGNRFLYEIRRLFLPRPVIDKDKCIVCKKCIQVCPVEPKVLEMSQRKKTPQYDYRRCIRCYCCHEMCPAKAIHIYEPTLKKLLPFLTYASLVFSVRHSKRASKKGTGAR